MNKLLVNVKPSDRDGTKVFVNLDNKTFLEIDWRMADQFARALTQTARRCEELEKAEAVARDHGLLLRAGIPVGLTDHPIIRAEAHRHAAWDRDFRRAIPGGIRSREEFGVLTVVRSPAPKTREP